VSDVSGLVPFNHLRWTGSLAVVGGSIGAAGTVAVSVGYYGTGSIRGSWLSMMPWIVVIVFGLLIRFLRGPRSGGASLGLAVLGSLLVGPAFVSGAARLRWINDPDIWPATGDAPPGIPASTAEWLVIGGLVAILLASLLVGISCWIPVARTSTLPGRLVPRSPYRIEVLALLFVLALVALATAPDNSVGAGTYGSFTGIAILLAWLVPLSLVLGLGLRSSGLGSLWIAGGLAIAVIAEPLIRSLGLIVWSGLGWNDAPDFWYQERAFATGSDLFPTLASAWLILPSLAIIAAVLLWNANPGLMEGPYSRQTPLSAPLDPWSGVSFTLAFIPLISVPALVLGHISYERIVSSDRPLRGRMLASAAIALGILNIAVVVLLASGALASLDDIWIGG